MQKTFMSIDEVADFLDIKPVTVKRYAREGLLDSVKDTNPPAFERSTVERFKEIQARLR